MPKKFCGFRLDQDTLDRLAELRPLHKDNTETVTEAIRLYRMLKEPDLKRIYAKDKPDIQ